MRRSSSGRLRWFPWYMKGERKGRRGSWESGFEEFREGLWCRVLYEFRRWFLWFWDDVGDTVELLVRVFMRYRLRVEVQCSGWKCSVRRVFKFQTAFSKIEVVAFWHILTDLCRFFTLADSMQNLKLSFAGNSVKEIRVRWLFKGNIHRSRSVCAYFYWRRRCQAAGSILWVQLIL